MRTEKPCEFIGLLTQALYREAKPQSRQSQVKQLHVSYGFAIKRDILSYTVEAAGRWPGANAAITKSGSVMLFLKKCVGNYTHAWILHTSYKPKQSRLATHMYLTQLLILRQGFPWFSDIFWTSLPSLNSPPEVFGTWQRSHGDVRCLYAFVIGKSVAFAYRKRRLVVSRLLPTLRLRQQRFQDAYVPN